MDAETQTTTTVDPPFDFAQGRLFGDDNQKNCNDKSEEPMQGFFAALRMTVVYVVA
jgi:hypothetical protein